MGHEIALARSARAVGRGVRHRPPGDEPGRAARLRQDHLEPGAPSFEFYWQPPGYAYDPVKAKQFLADAGYPNGFDAGDYSCDASLAYMGEPVVNYLNAIGIRVKLRPIERAAFQKGWTEKAFRGLIQGGNGSFGNAATRIESLVIGIRYRTRRRLHLLRPI